MSKALFSTTVLPCNNFMENFRKNYQESVIVRYSMVNIKSRNKIPVASIVKRMATLDGPDKQTSTQYKMIFFGTNGI